MFLISSCYQFGTLQCRNGLIGNTLLYFMANHKLGRCLRMVKLSGKLLTVKNFTRLNPKKFLKKMTLTTEAFPRDPRDIHVSNFPKIN